MDNNLRENLEARIARTVDALRDHGFDAHYIPTAADLPAKLDELMPKGSSCSVGGSMTLFETGVIDYLKHGEFEYFDRYAPGADIPDVYARAANCDFYFTSSNAITEDGCLYNIDGNGNRVAAIAYGPKKVVVVAGCNKLVTDLPAALDRRRRIAAPANNIRLKTKNPCVKAGVCVDCKAPTRICCHELISGRQCKRDRITVYILGESYGY